MSQVIEDNVDYTCRIRFFRKKMNEVASFLITIDSYMHIAKEEGNIIYITQGEMRYTLSEFHRGSSNLRKALLGFQEFCDRVEEKTRYRSLTRKEVFLLTNRMEAIQRVHGALETVIPVIKPRL